MGDEEGEEDELRKRQPDGAVGFVPSFVDVEDVIAPDDEVGDVEDGTCDGYDRGFISERSNRCEYF